MPDGLTAKIKHVSVDKTKEMLGFWSCPSGKAETTLEEMRTKAKEWVGRAKESQLQRRNIWFLVGHQMWPGVGYCLNCSMASWSQLDSCLKK